jgi:hypothetical protein
VRVQSNVGGTNHMIYVDALEPALVFTEVHDAGTLGGVACADSDTEGETYLTPWIVVHSGKNAEVNFRNGENPTDHATLTCEVVSECADFSTFNHFPTRIKSSRSLAARVA